MTDEAPHIESIETTGRSGAASGVLRMPQRNGAPWPAVLLCPGAPVEAPDFGPLLDDVAAAMTDAGFVTLVVSSRLADAAVARSTTADMLIDDADALLDWLIAIDVVDAARVSLIAYSTGTVAGAAICGTAMHSDGKFPSHLIFNDNANGSSDPVQ